LNNFQLFVENEYVVGTINKNEWTFKLIFKIIFTVSDKISDSERCKRRAKLKHGIYGLLLL